MKLVTILILACLSVIMLCSCASSERMMRLSPFDNRQIVNYNDSTVNLWPMFYNNGTYSAACWPIFDSDDKGFAVRPLYNQDGNEYSILFPLAAWNSQKGSGWVINTYCGNHSLGIVPLFHASEDFLIIYPLLFLNIRQAPTEEDKCRYNSYYFMFFFTYQTKNYPENMIPAMDIRIKQSGDKRKLNCETVSDKYLELIIFSCSFNSYNTWICNSKKLSYLNWKLNKTIEYFRCSKYQENDINTDDIIKTNADVKKEIAQLLQELKIKSPVPGNDEDIKKLQNTLYNHYCKKIECSDYSIPLLFNYNTFGKDVKWNALFFIICGSTENKKDNFSFLWRVYNAETENGKTSGHIMFIPFGQKEKK